ncbi:unnamed protein product [Linum tenue]|uniref:Uncharacterized protein n=1 Tax=Linum tenue TaxID=586396 RepID=A0AAV0JYS7_9ROSI|nr:unnamed protein product [Linum tenue]
MRLGELAAGTSSTAPASQRNRRRRI